MSRHGVTSIRVSGPKQCATLVLLLMLGSTAVGDAQDRGEGPMSLVIVYQCKPETRIDFRAYMTVTGVNEFEKRDKPSRQIPGVLHRPTAVTATPPFLAAADRDRQRHTFAVSWGARAQRAGGIVVPSAGYMAELVRGSMERSHQ